MDAATRIIRQHWYSAQIAFVTFLISIITFGTVTFAMRPTAWNVTWMIVLPIISGIALNRGIGRWAMAPLLLIVSLLATTVVGNAMGGI